MSPVDKVESVSVSQQRHTQPSLQVAHEDFSLSRPHFWKVKLGRGRIG